MALDKIVAKLRRIFPCFVERERDVVIGDPTNVRHMEISDPLPGLTDAQRKRIHEKASSDATRLLSLHSHPPSPPSTPPSPIAVVVPIPRLGPHEFGPGFASSIFESPISPTGSSTELQSPVSNDEARSDAQTPPPRLSYDEVEEQDITEQGIVEQEYFEGEEQQQYEEDDEYDEEEYEEGEYEKSLSQMPIPPLGRQAFGPEFASSIFEYSLYEISRPATSCTARPTTSCTAWPTTIASRNASTLDFYAPLPPASEEEVEKPTTILSPLRSEARTESLCESDRRGSGSSGASTSSSESSCVSDEEEEEIQPEKTETFPMSAPPQKQFLATFDFEFADDDARYRLDIL